MLSLPLIIVFVVNLFGTALSITEAESAFYKANDALCGIGISQWYPNTDFSTAFGLLDQLYLLSTGATTERKNKILELLSLSTENPDEARGVMNVVHGKFNVANDERYKTSMQLKMYGGADYVFTEDFKNSMSDIFQGSVENLDYSDPDGAIAAMSEWFGEGIQPAIKASDISSSTGLIILNKARVDLRFLPNGFNLYRQTTIPFTPINEETPVEVDAWYGEGNGKYAEVDDLTAYQFDLDGGFSAVFFAVSPSKLNATINKFRDPQYLADILDKGESKNLSLLMPINMRYKNSRDYRPELEQAGLMMEIFSPGDTGFPNIAKDKPVYVSNMLSYTELNIQTPTVDDTKTIAPQHVFKDPHFFVILCPDKSIVHISLQTIPTSCSA